MEEPKSSAAEDAEACNGTSPGSPPPDAGKLEIKDIQQLETKMPLTKAVVALPQNGLEETETIKKSCDESLNNNKMMDKVDPKISDELAGMSVEKVDNESVATDEMSCDEPAVSESCDQISTNMIETEKDKILEVEAKESVNALDKEKQNQESSVDTLDLKERKESNGVGLSEVEKESGPKEEETKEDNKEKVSTEETDKKDEGMQGIEEEQEKVDLIKKESETKKVDNADFKVVESQPLRQCLTLKVDGDISLNVPVKTPGEATEHAEMETSHSPCSLSPGSSVVARKGPRAKMTLSPPSGMSGPRPGVARKSCARKSMGCSSPKSSTGSRHFIDAIFNASPDSLRDSKKQSINNGISNKSVRHAEPEGQKGGLKVTLLPGGISIHRKETTSLPFQRDPSVEPRAKSVPKARKSFPSKTAKNRQSKSEDRDVTKGATFHATSLPITSMTFRLPEIENALGIKRRTLDKMDAKTLDNFVLQKVKKSRIISSGVKTNEPKNASGLPAIKVWHPKVQETSVLSNPVSLEAGKSGVFLGKQNGASAENNSCELNLATVITGQKLLLNKKKKKKKRECLGKYKLPGEKTYPKKPGPKPSRFSKAGNASTKSRQKKKVIRDNAAQNKTDLVNDWIDLLEDPANISDDGSDDSFLTLSSARDSVKSDSKSLPSGSRLQSSQQNVLRNPKRLSTLARRLLPKSQARAADLLNRKKKKAAKRRKSGKKGSSWAKGDVCSWKKRRMLKKKRAERKREAKEAENSEDCEPRQGQETIPSLFKKQKAASGDPDQSSSSRLSKVTLNLFKHLFSVPLLMIKPIIRL